MKFGDKCLCVNVESRQDVLGFTLFELYLGGADSKI